MHGGAIQSSVMNDHCAVLWTRTRAVRKDIFKDSIMNRDYENMTLIEAILLGCKRGLINFVPVGVVWKWLSKRRGK